MMTIRFLTEIVIIYQPFRLILEPSKFLLCSTFQLSDVRQELHRYFEVGKEINTYSSPSELIEKIDFYLSHKDERNAIARRGYKRTLKNHTYSQRLEFLLNVIFG